MNTCVMDGLCLILNSILVSAAMYIQLFKQHIDNILCMLLWCVFVTHGASVVTVSYWLRSVGFGSVRFGKKNAVSVPVSITVTSHYMVL